MLKVKGRVKARVTSKDKHTHTSKYRRLSRPTFNRWTHTHNVQDKREQVNRKRMKTVKRKGLNKTRYTKDEHTHTWKSSNEIANRKGMGNQNSNIGINRKIERLNGKLGQSWIKRPKQRKKIHGQTQSFETQSNQIESDLLWLNAKTILPINQKSGIDYIQSIDPIGRSMRNDNNLVCKHPTDLKTCLKITTMNFGNNQTATMETEEKEEEEEEEKRRKAKKLEREIKGQVEHGLEQKVERKEKRGRKA